MPTFSQNLRLITLFTLTALTIGAVSSPLKGSSITLATIDNFSLVQEKDTFSIQNTGNKEVGFKTIEALVSAAANLPQAGASLTCSDTHLAQRLTLEIQLRALGESDTTNAIRQSLSTAGTKKAWKEVVTRSKEIITEAVNAAARTALEPILQSLTDNAEISQALARMNAFDPSTAFADLLTQAGTVKSESDLEALKTAVQGRVQSLQADVQKAQDVRDTLQPALKKLPQGPVKDAAKELLRKLSIPTAKRVTELEAAVSNETLKPIKAQIQQTAKSALAAELQAQGDKKAEQQYANFLAATIAARREELERIKTSAANAKAEARAALGQTLEQLLSKKKPQAPQSDEDTPAGQEPTQPTAEETPAEPQPAGETQSVEEARSVPEENTASQPTPAESTPRVEPTPEVTARSSENNVEKKSEPHVPVAPRKRSRAVAFVKNHKKKLIAGSFITAAVAAVIINEMRTQGSFSAAVRSLRAKIARLFSHERELAA